MGPLQTLAKVHKIFDPSGGVSGEQPVDSGGHGETETRFLPHQGVAIFLALSPKIIGKIHALGPCLEVLRYSEPLIHML
jgi:hypothetical protein